MKIASTTLVALLLAALTALGQAEEEVETYLVAPYTLNKAVTVITTDGKKLEGKVVTGDDDKIVLQRPTGPMDLPTGQIQLLRFRRPKRSTKLDFVGSLIGGVGLGMAGAAIGKEVAKSIRDDDSPGRIGPIVGGIALGFVGGYVGRAIVRRAVTEEVTLKVTGGVEGKAPKLGSAILPEPPSHARVSPVDLRR